MPAGLFSCSHHCLLCHDSLGQRGWRREGEERRTGERDRDRETEKERGGTDRETERDERRDRERKEEWRGETNRKRQTETETVEKKTDRQTLLLPLRPREWKQGLYNAQLTESGKVLVIESHDEKAVQWLHSRSLE